MASLQQCEVALQTLVSRFAAVDIDLRRKHAADRTVSCRVPDLDVVFSVRLTDGHVGDVVCQTGPEADGQAQVRLAASSDDLVALVAGELTLPAAWATGRLSVEASVLDLLRLRSLL
jgi:predicted lipid carrier protein YhbT